jgi:hypothetical protein
MPLSSSIIDERLASSEDYLSFKSLLLSSISKALIGNALAGLAIDFLFFDFYSETNKSSLIYYL